MRPGVLDPDQYAAHSRSRRGASTSRLHRAADIIGPFPDRNGSMTRPSSLDRDQLLACGRGEMFGPGNARLPLPDRKSGVSGKSGSARENHGGRGNIKKTKYTIQANK